MNENHQSYIFRSRVSPLQNLKQPPASRASWPVLREDPVTEMGNMKEQQDQDHYMKGCRARWYAWGRRITSSRRCSTRWSSSSWRWCSPGWGRGSSGSSDTRASPHTSWPSRRTRPCPRRPRWNTWRDLEASTVQWSPFIIILRQQDQTEKLVEFSQGGHSWQIFMLSSTTLQFWRLFVPPRKSQLGMDLMTMLKLNSSIQTIRSIGQHHWK